MTKADALAPVRQPLFERHHLLFGDMVTVIHKNIDVWHRMSTISPERAIG